MPKTLGEVLREARAKRGLTLRQVEKRTAIRNAHLSQIEKGTIKQPEMSMLWELSEVYELDYGRLLRLAGYGRGPETSGRQRQRATVALRALHELSPLDQRKALRYMRELKDKSAGD